MAPSDDEAQELATLMGDDDTPQNLPDVALARRMLLSEEEQAAEVAWLSAFEGLKPKHADFVRHLIGGMTGTAAAKAAGYPPAGAHVQARRLLTERPTVVKAIDAYRELQRVRGEYTSERAMAELEHGLRMAEATKQGTAYMKGVELRARLFGLLIDRQEVVIETGPSLRTAMELAAKRVERGPVAIDAEFTEVKEP